MISYSEDTFNNPLPVNIEDINKDPFESSTYDDTIDIYTNVIQPEYNASDEQFNFTFDECLLLLKMDKWKIIYINEDITKNKVYDTNDITDMMKNYIYNNKQNWIIENNLYNTCIVFKDENNNIIGYVFIWYFYVYELLFNLLYKYKNIILLQTQHNIIEIYGINNNKIYEFTCFIFKEIIKHL